MSEASGYLHVCCGVRANVHVYVSSWGRGTEDPREHKMGKMAAIESEKSKRCRSKASTWHLRSELQAGRMEQACALDMACVDLCEETCDFKHGRETHELGTVGRPVQRS